MITQRPTFQTGQGVQATGTIQRVLFCDGVTEVYALDKTVTHLLVLSRAGESPEAWLKALATGGATCLPLSGVGSGTAAAFLLSCEPAGDWAYAGDGGLGRWAGDDLSRLLRAMVVTSRAATVQEAFPDFDPGLCWVGPQQETVVTVRAASFFPATESARVRETVRAFYRLVVGVEPEVVAGKRVRLAAWARHASSALNDLVARYVEAGEGVNLTFTGLLEALAISATARPVAPSPGGATQGVTAPMMPGSGLVRVAGMQKLKHMLTTEVVAPVREPDRFARYGLTVPNGLLLYGPPGCGKTYIARQLAEELGHHFVEIIPSEIASPFVHQGVARIRELFDEAEQRAPSVIFIDEIDALAPARSELGGHQHYKAEEVNEFLACLNNCSEKRIFVIAASNRPERIDPALLRTGRLDKLVYVGPPDPDARSDMLTLHLAGRPVAGTLDVPALARALTGYAASDIRFLVDEAARKAMEGDCDIGEDQFEAAMMTVRPSVLPEVEAQYRGMDERG